MNEQAPQTITGETCPICLKKQLSLTESVMDVPFFGKMFLFSMQCNACKYHKSDIESAVQKEPCKYTFEVQCKEDLNVRIVKSSEATVKISYIGNIEPGPASQGYVTNIEGILTRMKKQVEAVRDAEEDNDQKKKAKNLLKKLQKILWGTEKVKITIEDPSGNSAIISEKAVRTKLK